jgi:hypothetical protein
MKPKLVSDPALLRLCTCAVLLYSIAIFQRPTDAAVPVVGLWRFNEGSGTNVADASGFNNNGTLAGENGNVPGWASGQTGFGGALRFTNNGVDHAYVQVPGSSSLKIGQLATDPWTITAWAYEDSGGSGVSVATYGRILVLDDGDAFQLESGADLDEQIYTWSRQNQAWQIGWGVGSAVAPLLDQWVHWAVVYDGTNLTIYRNGNQGAQGGTASMPVAAALGYGTYTGAVLIGSELAQPGSRTWNGLLDDVAIFAGALTEAEIQTVMAGDFSAHLGGPAHLLSQPQSQTVHQGANVTFNVAAQGVAPLSYQWYFDATNALTGATSASLTLTNVQANQAGAYTVTLTNSLGSDTSLPALLTVNTNKAFLVGLWRFNEGTGTNAFDSSGFQNNGTLIGENGNTPGWVAGQAGFGGALWFTNDGGNHAYVDIAGSNSLMVGLTATDTWTMTAWAYEDSGGTSNFLATYGRLFVLDGGDAFQFESGAQNDGQMYTWSRQNTGWQVGWGTGSSVTPLLDQWIHWAVIYDGASLTLYRNANQGAQGGKASVVRSAALGYANYLGAVQIGSESGQPANRNWNGMLDDVAIFNGVLSQTEIASVMSGDFSVFLVRPPVSITQTQQSLTLTWPAEPSGFQLQASPTLSSSQWTDVSVPPVPQGTNLTVTLPIGPGTQFFRLLGP